MAQEAEPEPAPVRPADEPVWICPPMDVPVHVDGNLAEWEGLTPLEIGPDHLTSVQKERPYAGESDLSGRIYVARSATTIYVAGEILDDTLFWNPQVTWLGDGVELFFDFHPSPEARKDNAYDEYCHQLLLHPLADQTRYKFESYRGVRGRPDDPVDGIRVAGLELRDGKSGYTFEVAIPLANFPAAQELATTEGATFGFDVGLSDSDGLPQQKHYATLSTRSDLFRFPKAFGRMRFGDAPPPAQTPGGTPFSPIGPTAFLAVVLGGLLFLWLGRAPVGSPHLLARALGWMRSFALRPKLIVGIVLGALIVLAGIAGSTIEDALESRDVDRKRTLFDTVAEVADEAGRERLLEPQLPSYPSPLVALLAGQSLRPPVEYSYSIVPTTDEPPHRTLGGVPFLKRSIPASSAWPGEFVVHPPVRAESATLVYSWVPEPGAEPPEPGAPVAEFRFVHQNGSVDSAEPLVFGRHVIPFDAPLDPERPETGGPSAENAGVAYIDTVERDGGEFVESGLECQVPLPGAASDSPLVRIEVQQTATGGTFLIHGVTLHPRTGLEPVLLPLGKAAASGMPTGAWPFPARHDGLQLHVNHSWAVLECGDLPADRIWIVASLRKGYRQHRYGTPVALIEAVFDDGSVDAPFRLENGVSIDLESTRGTLHDEGYRAELAFEWGVPGEQRWHYDVMPLELARPGRVLRELQFEFTGEDEFVRVASVIVGRQVAAERDGERQWIARGDDGSYVPEDLREQFAGLDFSLFRDGAAVATTAGGEARERQLARRLSSEEAARIAAAEVPLHTVRVIDGVPHHSLLRAGLGGRGNEVLEISWTRQEDSGLGNVVLIVRAVLVFLLVPLVVSILADLVLRLSSLHARLVAGFAAAAAIPVGLGVFAVPGLLESQIETTERETVLAKSATIKTRLADLRSQARRQAELAFRDEALQEALMRIGADDFRAGVAGALRDVRRIVSTNTGVDARISLQLFPLSGQGAETLVFPERSDVFAADGGDVNDQIAYRYGRLAALGVTRDFDEKNNWKKTLVVELPLDRPTLHAASAAAGGDTEILLYSARGYPLVSTLDMTGEDAPAELRRKQEIRERILTDQQPRVLTRDVAGEPHTVAFDVLRVARDQVCLVATALPRGTADALLNRVGYVSILVFGAGVFLQFLLAGLLVTATFRPVAALLGHLGIRPGVRPDGGEPEPGEDELSVIGSAVERVRADRDLYQDELARLHDAVGALSAHDDPAEVVAETLAIVRDTLTPWGAVILARDVDGEGREIGDVLGGFRGDARVPTGPVPLTPGGPLARVVAGEGEAHVRSAEELASSLGPEELRLLGVSHGLDAYPLSGPEGASGATDGGALLLLEPSRRDGAPRPAHAEFVATFARHVGVALSGARLVRLAVRDTATGAYVASYFDQRLTEEVDRAVSARRAIAFLLVRAAQLPAEPGEQTKALRRMASAVRSRLPDRAFLGRTDDATLAVGVPETDRAAAEALAIELRRTLAEPGLSGLRARVGMAACPDDAGSSEFLRLEAERALGAGPLGAAPLAVTDGHDARTQLKSAARHLGAVFESEKGLQMLETIERIADSRLTILIDGETGAGKEVVADLIHKKSARADGPLVKVNCAALPDALLESELFGYEAGAFTGADRTKPGRFELAEGGTLFLDEVGEMPLSTQVKLLRVLEDRVVEHLGGTRPIPVDVRVIAATNRDLRAAIADGRFREDLYYRLNGVTISVPPLRARQDDIPVLAELFAHAAAESHGVKPPELAPDAMDLLFRHSWPGNVRELRNVIEQGVVLNGGDVLRARDLRPGLRVQPVEGAGAPARGPARTVQPPPDISNRQRRLLGVLTERDWITNAEYCEIVGISTRTGLRDLKELIERGVLVMEGKRRGARYRLRD